MLVDRSNRTEMVFFLFAAIIVWLRSPLYSRFPRRGFHRGN